MPTYRVHVTKDYLVFSAAHFITFNGNICERLHGHNYRVEVTVEDDLDENRYVIDFIALRDAAKRLVDRWDHYVLLPTQHPAIRVTHDDREVTATFEDRRWVFPLGDCVLLPVPNTTAEELARCFGEELMSAVEQILGRRPRKLIVGIDENNGQWGICEFDRS